MRKNWTRREFLQTLGTASFAGTVAPFRTGPVIDAGKIRKKRVAIIATEIRRWSHAEHFVDRFLEGYGWEGRHHYPPFQLAGLYVDQAPPGDLTPDRARRHQSMKVYPTIAEALTLGTSRLAVDGVLIIGEHGKYPRNEKGQTLYPRHKFFKEVVKVFEASGRTVPVFNDKHLSTDWNQAKEMVADSKRLGFPFLAGSSLPVTYRIPALELPKGIKLRESVCVCYGGVDSYDFHGLETAQCMSERRAGGETGVSAIHAVRGERVWAELEKRPGTRELMFAALARSHTCRAPDGYTAIPPTVDWIRQASSDPVAYFIEHNDGFRTAMFLLNGYVQDFTYAGRSSNGEVFSTLMYLPMPGFSAVLANFFSPLVHNIEEMLLTGRAPYPIERTLLTTGMVEKAVESLHAGQTRLQTPELKVVYSAPAGSHFWRT